MILHGLGMTVEAIKGAVQSAIQRASQATGVDFGFLLGTAKRESGYNPVAKAGSSSASGLFQFVDQTWLSTLKKHGAKYGYARYADLITQGADGRFVVNGAEAKSAVLGLKLDPHAASLMAGELTSDHAAYLRGRVGRMPTSGELYAAHFLGPQGSARLIEAVNANPSANAAAMFPEAAAANRNIFYPAGRAASVADLYARLTEGKIDTPSTTNSAPKEFMQYASARRSDQLQREQAMVEFILRGSQDVEPSVASSGSRLTSAMFSSEMLRVLSEASSGVRGR